MRLDDSAGSPLAGVLGMVLEAGSVNQIRIRKERRQKPWKTEIRHVTQGPTLRDLIVVGVNAWYILKRWNVAGLEGAASIISSTFCVRASKQALEGKVPGLQQVGIGRR